MVHRRSCHTILAVLQMQPSELQAAVLQCRATGELQVAVLQRHAAEAAKVRRWSYKGPPPEL
jgi:hypothetical protein